MTFILAMATYALVLSISPGPVNMMTLSSGVNYGFWRTLPFIGGATLGFTGLLYGIGLGGEAVLQAYPLAMKTMHVVGTGFILYLGVRIICAQANIEMTAPKHPKFWEGVLLQWLNPKAWIACVSGIGAFVIGRESDALMLFCLIYLIVCFLGISFWAVLGVYTQKLLKTEKRLRLFNKMMGVGLCGVALYLFFI